MCCYRLHCMFSHLMSSSLASCGVATHRQEIFCQRTVVHNVIRCPFCRTNIFCRRVGDSNSNMVNYLRRHLASGEGIVTLDVTRCVCVRRTVYIAYRLHAALVSAAKVMRSIQCSYKLWTPQRTSRGTCTVTTEHEEQNQLRHAGLYLYNEHVRTV